MLVRLLIPIFTAASSSSPERHIRNSDPDSDLAMPVAAGPRFNGAPRAFDQDNRQQLSDLPDRQDEQHHDNDYSLDIPYDIRGDYGGRYDESTETDGYGQHDYISVQMVAFLCDERAVESDQVTDVLRNSGYANARITWSPSRGHPQHHSSSGPFGLKSVSTIDELDGIRCSDIRAYLKDGSSPLENGRPPLLAFFAWIVFVISATLLFREVAKVLERKRGSRMKHGDLGHVQKMSLGDEKQKECDEGPGVNEDIEDSSQPMG